MNHLSLDLPCVDYLKYFTFYNTCIGDSYLVTLVYKTCTAVPEYQQYFVGYQVAKYLGKKSSRMYTCLRNRNVQLINLSENRIRELISHGILKKGLTLAVIIPADECLLYIQSCETQEIDKYAKLLMSLRQ